MKYFIIIIFSFLTIVVNAQLNMEEIAYVPSPSGYYNNLVVKGNSRIHELRTSPFNIQSYSSVLDLNLSTTSAIFIQNLTVASSGTVGLSSSLPITQFANLSIQNPGGANPVTRPQIGMNGGNLIITRSTAGQDPTLSIQSFTFQSTDNKFMNVRTRDISYQGISDINFLAEQLYIMGMQVPPCPHGYFWTTVTVAPDSQYTVLACNQTSCTNPEQEEACVTQTGKCWKDCTCKSGTDCPQL